MMPMTTSFLPNKKRNIYSLSVYFLLVLSLMISSFRSVSAYSIVTSISTSTTIRTTSLVFLPVSRRRAAQLKHLSFRSTRKTNNISKDRMHSLNSAATTSTAKSDDDTTSSTSSLLTVGNRIQQTAEPCVILMKQITSEYANLWKDKGGIYSLAQGVVYWKPPPMAYNTIIDSLSSSNSDVNLYNPADGIPALVSALKEKLTIENNLSNVNVMVTAGANQAYMNCVLTLLGEGQKCVLFRPYYFNHLMAVQMTRGNEGLLVGPCVGDTGLPDVDWLQQQLEQQQQQRHLTSNERINLVTVVDPCNPTGLKIPNTTMKRVINLCKQYGVWVVVDNTYEHFDHTSNNGGEYFTCYNESNVINIFSFSKGYSLAGFRVGYITVSNASVESRDMYNHMLKVQDTIPICAARVSQLAALGALQQPASRQWVTDKVNTLTIGREAVKNALNNLDMVIGGSGAMYFMGKLPPTIDGTPMDDVEFARMLVRDFGIAVIPGSFCAAPGWIRVCYSNLEPAKCVEAALRLANGINHLICNT